MSDVTMSGCKVCVVNPRTSKFGEYCRAECRNVGEAYARGEQNERNRIADAMDSLAKHADSIAESVASVGISDATSARYYAETLAVRRAYASFAERLRKGEV